jgi:hypothetical protein
MDSQYKAAPFIFASRGINARNAPDRLPQGSYINLLGGFERLEETISSRYGSRIINREPDNFGDGVNFFFADPVNTITRLKYNAATYRYAGSGSELFRRVGDTQGQYTSIVSGLSGQPFGNAVTNTFASSQPYIFIADQNLMLKDNGTGTPSQWGITPPNQPANATEFAPQLLLIDGFNEGTGAYTLSNVTGFAEVPIGVVTVTTSEPVNNFFNFGGVVTNFIDAFTGGLAATDAGPQAVIFNPYGAPNPEQFSAAGVSTPLPGTARNFTLTGYAGSVAANVTGTIGRTVDLDLSQDNQVTDQHLICFAMQLDNPANISQINIMFDINNSGYTSSYYQASVAPAYYQSGLDNTTDAYTTTSNEILALSLGVVTGDNSAQQQQLTQSIVNQLQPSQANTGLGAWSTVYTQRGNFLAVGNAGQPGFDWASVTGWQIQVVTTTSGTVTIGCNGLYLQWNGGPSSFGGVGYDYRYTYFNFNTQTESNPSQEQMFNTQFGYPASYIPPIVLCQNFNVNGLFSSDPQVTHIRLYRRGGYMNANWYYLDQIPNVTAGGTFSYKDIIPDAYILQSNILALDNDAPITSSLQNPIVTTLVSASTSPGTSPYDLFAPQTITTADLSTFLPNQLVVVGTPQNLEQVSVVTGGVGTFTAVLRLIHQAGEQVQVFSIPQQPCDLVTLAYGQLWVAGDPNNPHFLYYSKPGYPENFSPQNYIPCGSPSSPIMAVINYRGNLFVATLTTWYAISPGNPPYAQPTGSTHGLVSKTGWTQTESSIWYEAIDGIREFKGADGPYRSLPIEWIFQDVPQTPLPLLDRTQIGNVCAGFLNNQVFFGYQALDGTQNRVNFDTNYQRWRNDNVPATAMYLEQDTNVLLFAKAITAGAESGFAICQEWVGDYDDGGWVNGQLTKTPIDMGIQMPFEDLGAPHFPKNWNTVEIDANTNGQTMDVILNFDDGIAPLNIGTINTTFRQKIQLDVNGGLGQESYKCSPQITASTIVAPILYQLNVYAAVLAADRDSLDTYWTGLNGAGGAGAGGDVSKFVKQAYLDYTSTEPVTIAIYADGGLTPYYSVTLPAQPNRAVIRVRFPALKLRLFRMIVTSNAPMQNWTAPRIEWKPIQASGANSYAVYEIST